MSKTPSVTVSSALTQRVTTATTNAFNALQDQLRRVFQQEALQLKQSGGTATLRMVEANMDKVKRWTQASAAAATLDAGIAKFFKLPADMKQQALLPVTSNDARNQVFADVSRRGADTGLKAQVAAVLTGTAAALASWWNSAAAAAAAAAAAKAERADFEMWWKENMGPTATVLSKQETADANTELMKKMAAAPAWLAAQAAKKTYATAMTPQEWREAQAYKVIWGPAFMEAKTKQNTFATALTLKQAQEKYASQHTHVSPQRGYDAEALREATVNTSMAYRPPRAPELSIWDKVTGTVSGWWESLTGNQAVTSLLPVILLSLTVAAGGYALWKWAGSGTQTVTVDQFVQMKLTERESQEGLQSLGIRYDQDSDEFRPVSNDPMHVGRAKLFTLLKGNGSITVNTATVKVQ